MLTQGNRDSKQSCAIQSNRARFKAIVRDSRQSCAIQGNRARFRAIELEYITVERHDLTTQGSSLLATANRAES